MACLREVRESLARIGLHPTVAQIRWAVDSGKILRPLLDGSLRFDYTEIHVEQLKEYFEEKSFRSLFRDMEKFNRDNKKQQVPKAKPIRKKGQKS